MRIDEQASDEGIEDRRGQGSSGFGGGGFPISLGRGAKLGVPGLVVVLLLTVLGRGALGGGGSGSALNDALNQIGGGQAQVGAAPATAAGGTQDEQYRFVRFVRDNVQAYWTEEFSHNQQSYHQAGLVIFDAPTPTGCGTGDPQTGPFYCPRDEKVYIDFGFYQELSSRFGIKGDFALAYVIAHEMGHHVQNMLGISDKVDQQTRDHPEKANELSVKLELQADCLAGVWAHAAYQNGRLQPGDLDEAINAAQAVGDDRIQAKTQGRISPETFTHGTAAERSRWFKAGFDAGDSKSCDTFSS